MTSEVLALQQRLIEQRSRPYVAAENLYLPILIGRRSYLLPASLVKRVLLLDSMSRLPFAPARIAGLIQSGGAVITVIDLRVMQGKESSERTIRSRAICFDDDSKMAILVDRAFEMVPASAADIRPAENASAPFVKYCAKDVEIIDVEALEEYICN